MRQHWSILFPPLLFFLLLGYFLAPTAGQTTLEEKAADGLLCLRYRLRGPLPADRRIVLIGLDDAFFTALGKPQVFWEPELARLSQALLDGGAKAVALDLVLNVDSSRLSPAIQEEFLTGRLPLLQLLAGGKLFLVDLPAIAGARASGAHPHPDLAAAAEESHAVVSGLLDSSADGVTRLIPLEAPPEVALAYRLAQMEGKLPAFPREMSGPTPMLRLNPPTPYWNWVSAGSLWARVARGEALPEFQGKLCLVGPRADSFQDQRPGSFDLLADKLQNGGTLGLEHHAAALDTLLSQRFLVPYSPLAGALAACFLALVSAAIAFALPFRISLLSQSLLWVGYAALASLAFVYAGQWWPLLAPLLASLISYGWGYVIRYLKVEKDREKTRDFFSRMVAPQVVERLLNDHSLQALGGTQRRVTVLYSDINDFTPMCERHTPAEVIVMINAYFREMVEIIFRSEGMLKQFVGDEIMVIYGAPADQPDHAARAVRTALEMNERLQQLGELSHGQDGFFDVKLGIHTGDVVVGHVGSELHMEYAAVGDDVNLGARIMATTKKVGCKILISDVTRREAAPHLPDVEWISHGVQSFKGKTAQIEVFEARRVAQKTGDK